ncbi:MAG: hypothetical protein OQJ97_16870 [Rhodospirillales bacterium]|nr:hypothetical protein [Rhodospirillales bacterium]
MALDSGGIGSERAATIPTASAEGAALMVSKEVAQVQKEVVAEMRERPTRDAEDIVDVKNKKAEEASAAAASAAAAGDAKNENAASDKKDSAPQKVATGVGVSISV